ncbi:hypothetical protein [Mycoplasma zalophi]|uniref:hypothetical protein n=1 Tax=Mycoplasma zalophi TaxID=191287 RepID=UPI001C104B4C|nr:hypothetical protein [Mycoplasma zalophi]MBU4690716.1 hypothetical protein [Mycoplasma zalophi]
MYHCLTKIDVGLLGYKRHFSQLKETIIYLTNNKKEQMKIASILNVINANISLLKRLWFCSKNQLFHVEKNAFLLKNTFVWFQEKVENLFKWYSIRNNSSDYVDSYTVSNTLGFINQKEYFSNGGKAINANKKASKIIFPNSFAFNPSRINVGSLAYYSNPKKGLISNIYEVFCTQNIVNDNFIKFYFRTNFFNNLISSNKNTGVRDTFSLAKIPDVIFLITNKKEQEIISRLLHKLDMNISLLKRK